MAGRCAHDAELRATLAAGARARLTVRSGPAAILPAMKRSRRRERRRPLAALPTPPASPLPSAPDSKRLLVDQIAAGELDPHLMAIAEAIHARYELPQTINSAKAIAMLNVGHLVRINHHASPPLPPRRRRRARRAQRDRLGEIRCPPLVLDRLNPVA